MVGWMSGARKTEGEGEDMGQSGKQDSFILYFPFLFARYRKPYRHAKKAFTLLTLK